MPVRLEEGLGVAAAIAVMVVAATNGHVGQVTGGCDSRAADTIRAGDVAAIGGWVCLRAG